MLKVTGCVRQANCKEKKKMSHLSLRSKNNNYNNSQNPKKLRKNRSLDDSQLSFKLQEKSINSENDFKNYQNYKKLKTDYDEACSLIDKNVLADLRALVNPPYMAKLSAEAILILLEITNRKVNWNEVKKHLSKNIKFLDSVRNFEPEILSKDKLQVGHG